MKHRVLKDVDLTASAPQTQTTVPIITIEQLRYIKEKPDTRYTRMNFRQIVAEAVDAVYREVKK